jgi:hypothetical protein
MICVWMDRSVLMQVIAEPYVTGRCRCLVNCDLSSGSWAWKRSYNKYWRYTGGLVLLTSPGEAIRDCLRIWSGWCCNVLLTSPGEVIRDCFRIWSGWCCNPVIDIHSVLLYCRCYWTAVSWPEAHAPSATAAAASSPGGCQGGRPSPGGRAGLSSGGGGGGRLVLAAGWSS